MKTKLLTHLLPYSQFSSDLITKIEESDGRTFESLALALNDRVVYFERVKAGDANLNVTKVKQLMDLRLVDEDFLRGYCICRTDSWTMDGYPDEVQSVPMNEYIYSWLKTESLRAIMFPHTHRKMVRAMLAEDSKHVEKTEEAQFALPDDMFPTVPEWLGASYSERVGMLHQGFVEAKACLEEILDAPEKLPGEDELSLMRGAFRMTSSCGPEQKYKMTFAFKTLDELHTADDQWREFVAIRSMPKDKG